MVHRRLSVVLLFLWVFGQGSAVEEQVEKAIRTFMEEKQIPGLAAVVVNEGNSRIYTFGFADREKRNPVDRNTIFNLASVTKVFVTTAVAVEVEERRMNLDEAAKDYIPGLREKQVRGFGQVRIVDLASHTAGMPHDPPLKLKGGKFRKQEILRYLQEWQPPYAVGTRYAYSNTSFGILDLTLEGVTGQTLEQVFNEVIFRPLGMVETELEVPLRLQALRAPGYMKTGTRTLHFQPNTWPGGGSLNSSASDMEKFLLANMGLTGPRALIEAMKLAQQTVFKVDNHLSLGLAWQNVTGKGLPIIDKNGGVAGYSSYIGFTADKRYGVVLLANKGGTELTTLGRKVLRMLAK